MDNLDSILPTELRNFGKEKIVEFMDILSDPKKCALIAGSLVAVYAAYRKFANERASQNSFPDFPGATWYRNHRALMQQTDSAGQGLPKFF